MKHLKGVVTPRNAAYSLALALGLAVAVMGYISSFDNLSRYAAAHGFPFGAVLPLGLDLGAPALLILDWLRPNAFLRSTAWSLVGFTVFANGAVAGGGLREQLLHAMLPAVASLIVEAARHLKDDAARMDRVRLSRWLLSPIRTARLQRRMVLWEITSYSEALTRESAILHARTVLVSAYGKRSWLGTRRHVPRTLVHQLATGQLPSAVLYGPDLQIAVRDWVRQTLEELALQPSMVPASAAGSREDQAEVPEAGELDPWDLIWDLRDSLCPAGVQAGTFAQAIGLARNHFEQVGTHIRNQDLQDQLKIQKARANSIGQVLRTSYETGPDLAVPTQDPAPQPAPAAAGASETSPDPARTAGLNGGPYTPADAS
ncbi:DUF2637 domain-containing protein [Actinomadura scrupuli]|uniref:DUF2637 domain-containing protein n=1 Tax=Actinomadura scrupuli TaxID=559629 RepID=UPI003D991CD5